MRPKDDGRHMTDIEKAAIVHHLSSSFDQVAPFYDDLYSAKANAVMAWLRRENLALMQEVFPPGGYVLDIGCGTGEEAVALARAGYRVLATDVSPRMVALTMRRARAAGVAHRVQGVALAASDLVALHRPRHFDGAYASFGSLNCEPNLPAVAEALARLLKPGAVVVCSVMARWCPFEVVWFALHGRGQEATRRWSRGWHDARVAVGNGEAVEVPVRYLSLGDVAHAFAPHFSVTRALAFPLLLPPPYLDDLFRRFPRFWRWVEKVERAVREVWPWNRLGDHILLVLKRERGALQSHAGRAARGKRWRPPSVFRCRGPVSAAPTVADINEDGRPDIIIVADAMYVCRVDGTILPGFPVRGKNAFASRPAVGDINGDGRLEIVVGCDDNCVYAVNARGRSLPGWPVCTDGDVYSSPALADLNGDGRLEIVVGSDDGRVYAWRGDGVLAAGWPRATRGFVASSPRVADVNDDGHPEVVVGSWDGGVYIWRGDGQPLDGWPQFTGHFVWSSPALADVNRDGYQEIFIASDLVYGWRHDATRLDGWPQETSSYNVASPLLVDLDDDGWAEVVQVSDKVYAWRADGSPLPGFPLDLGTFVWAPPAWMPGLGLVLTGWDGRVYLVNAQGQSRVLGDLTVPIFAPPVVADLDNDGGREILVAGWDGGVYRINPHLSAPVPRDDDALPLNWPTLRVAEEAGFVGELPAGVPPFIVVPAPPAPRAVLWYRADHEPAWHPVPLVIHAGNLTGLIQPFPRGTEVAFFVQVFARHGEKTPPVPGHRVTSVPTVPGATRYPPRGVWRVRFTEGWRARLPRGWRRARALAQQISHRVRTVIHA